MVVYAREAVRRKLSLRGVASLPEVVAGERRWRERKDVWRNFP